MHEHRVIVWDPAIRLFHWILAVTVIFLWVSGEMEALSWHMKIGPLVLALVVFRVAWGFVGSSTARFSQFVKGPSQILAYLAAARAGHARSFGHNPLGALSVLAILAVLAIQTASGLFSSDDIFTDGPLAYLVSSGTVKTLSMIHRWSAKAILALFVLHLCAVAFYGLVKKDDILPAMIHGKKKVPLAMSGISPQSSLLALVVFGLSAALVWGGLAMAVR